MKGNASKKLGLGRSKAVRDLARQIYLARLTCAAPPLAGTTVGSLAAEVDFAMHAAAEYHLYELFHSAGGRRLSNETDIQLADRVSRFADGLSDHRKEAQG